MFCRSLFVLLYFFFWPLCCLFFDIRILIAPFGIFKLFLIKIFYLSNIKIVIGDKLLKINVREIRRDIQELTTLGTKTKTKRKPWMNPGARECRLASPERDYLDTKYTPSENPMVHPLQKRRLKQKTQLTLTAIQKCLSFCEYHFLNIKKQITVPPNEQYIVMVGRW